MLRIEGLRVRVDGGDEVLRGVDLLLEEGETHVLIGPNACGKSTLALTVVGYPTFQITAGSIQLDGRELAGRSITERARLGIAMAFQSPPEVRGVKLGNLIRMIAGSGQWDPEVETEESVATPYLERVGLEADTFLARDVNLGFSGGEKKRAELAQVFAMKPRLMILDEPDSGVDIDSIRLIGPQIGEAARETRSSVLVITHHRHILQYLRPDKAHVMYAGRIIRSGAPAEILSEVEKRGYEGFAGHAPGGA